MKSHTLLTALLLVFFVSLYSACGPASPKDGQEQSSEEPTQPREDDPQEQSSSGAIDIIEEKKIDREKDEDGENSRRSITARVSDPLMQAAEGTEWEISISFSGEGSTAEGNTAEGEIRFRRPSNLPESGESENSDHPQNSKQSQNSDKAHNETIYSLSLAPLQQTLHFPHGAVGFLPKEITIEVSSSAKIEEIILEADMYDHDGPAEEMEPVSADLGVILNYPKEQWRREEYELFRWNLVPKVLIFDFADYAVQRDYFTRLAFFVGVTGESGRIEEHSYYEGRHVFNAHDYRPEDLAAFYRQAEEQGIGLNKEEQLVRDIALNQGVLRKKDGVISAGEGAILSTAQEIPPYLQGRLLAHEAIHGIFYAVPDFREGAFSIHKDMSELEREFWYSFLGNKGRLDNRSGYDGYDVENEYLLINEIAGHIMQLQPHEVDPYFLDVYLPRLEELLPEKKSAFQNIRRDHSDMFAHTRAELEALLEKTLGVRRGNLFITEKVSGDGE
ncbi:MAG: hypothetical protein R6V67_07600 [Spirochaetia bacterium]